MAGCVFDEIIAGDLSAFIVADTPEGVAFLDTRPVFPGHTLVVPRKHIETLADLPPADVGPFFEFVRRVAVGVETALGADGTFVAMNNKVSQSVPHLHVHVVPRRRKDGLRGFFWPRTKYESPEVAEEHAERISAEVARLLAV